MVAQRSISIKTAQCESKSREEDVCCDANDYVAMLIQDWLAVSKFQLTLRCFVEECKQAGKTLPGPEKWYHMTEQLQLDLAPRKVSKDHETKLPGSSALPLSLLEAVVKFTFAERQKDVHMHRKVQQQPTVLVSKKMHAKEFRLASSKRMLSATSSAPTLREASPTREQQGLVSRNNAIGGAASNMSTMLRPKSAAVCKSTSELITRSLLGNSSSNATSQSVPPASPGNNENRSSGTGIAPRTKMRPISAAGILTPNRDSVSKKSSPSIDPPSPTIINQQQPASRHPSLSLLRRSLRDESVTDLGQLVELRHASRISISGLPFISEDKTGLDARLGNAIELDGAEHGNSETPGLELEEMSEERLTTHYASLDKSAIKKLRRVLAKSSACTQEFEKSKRTIDKIQTRAKLRQLRRVLSAEQTPLLSSTMDSLNKEPCSLCQYVFLKKNLAMKVSYKSIYDLRASWTKQKKKCEQNKMGSDVCAPGEPSKCEPESANSDDEVEAGGQGRGEVGRAQQAHLYDEVPICVFCSQLVLNFSSYRVRWGRSFPPSVASHGISSDTNVVFCLRAAFLCGAKSETC